MQPEIKRCFMSHAYADTDAIAFAVAALPDGVEAVVFPSIVTSFDERVSDRILPTLLSCDALIYLRGGASEKSLWVAFERDFALRSGLRVYSFDPTSGSYEQDVADPIPLRVEVFYSRLQTEQVAEILDWMARERHFKLDRSPGMGFLGGIKAVDIITIEELLGSGGVVLWLASQALDAFTGAYFSYDPALLSNWWELEPMPEYGGLHSVFARLDPSYRSRSFATGAPVIELLDGAPEAAVWRPSPHVPSDDAAAEFDRSTKAGTGELARRLLCNRPAFLDLMDPDGAINFHAVDDMIVSLYRALLLRGPFS